MVSCGASHFLRRLTPIGRGENVMHHKKPSATIGANSYAYVHRMVEAGKAENVGEVLGFARRLDNRATLDRETARYFSSMKTSAAAEEVELENAVSAASQDLDLDQS